MAMFDVVRARGAANQKKAAHNALKYARAQIFVPSSQCAQNLKYLTCSYCDTVSCCVILGHALHMGFMYCALCCVSGVQCESRFVQSQVQCRQPCVHFLVCTVQCKVRQCAVCALLLGRCGACYTGSRAKLLPFFIRPKTGHTLHRLTLWFPYLLF